jgi:hypothetical protein
MHVHPLAPSRLPSIVVVLMPMQVRRDDPAAAGCSVLIVIVGRFFRQSDLL